MSEKQTDTNRSRHPSNVSLIDHADDPLTGFSSEIVDTLDSFSEAFTAIDSNWRIEHLNRKAESLYQASRYEAIGQRLWDIIPQAIGTHFEYRLRQCLRKGEDTVFKTVHPPRDDWFQARVVARASGGLNLFLKELPAPDHSSSAAYLKDLRFKALIDATAAVVWKADFRGNVYGQNSLWQSITGQTPEQAQGFGWLDAVHPEDRPRTAVTWRRSLATQSHCIANFRLRYFNGTYHPVAAQAVPVRDLAGKVVEWIATCVESDDDSQAEALLESQSRALELAGAAAPLREILDDMARSLEQQSSRPILASVYLTDRGRESLTLSAAPSFPDRLAGALASSSNASAEKWSKLEQRQSCVAIDRLADAFGPEAAAAAQAEGLQSFWPTLIRSRRSDLLGVILSFYRSSRDPSLAERRALRLLSQSAALIVESRSQKLNAEAEPELENWDETAPAILIETDARGDCIRISDTWRKLTGQTPDESRARGWFQRVHPDDQEAAQAALARAVSEQSEFRTRFRARDMAGGDTWLLAVANPRFSASRTFLGHVGSLMDVTELKQAEQALRESEEKFRNLADNISQFVWIADPAGRIFWFNQRWLDYTGATLETMVGTGWTKAHHPDHLDRVLDQLRRCWETGEDWEDTFPLRAKDGTYRWFLSRAVPIRDSDGRILHWFGTNTDITKQRDLEQKLRVADQRKNEALATLAHELRNPLAPISSGLNVLKDQAPHNPKVTEIYGMMERQLHVMARQIDELLDISRISQGRFKLQRELHSLNEIVRGSVESCAAHAIAKNHVVTSDLPSQPLYVSADAVRLGQVFSNLLNNAIKYTEPGGNISISLESRDRTAIVRVVDDGVGLDESQLDRIFERFWQANQPSENSKGGLGLGLSISRGIVQMHGGSIQARSEGIGRGSSFAVRLPLSRKQPDADFRSDPIQKSDTSDPATRKRTLKVVVVDDSEDVAKTMAMVVSLHGNEAHVALDGQECLRLVQEIEPDLVLLDLGMPHMDGYEVCSAIRQMRNCQALKIAALTGSGRTSERLRTQEHGFDFHFVKPVDPREILKLLDSL